MTGYPLAWLIIVAMAVIGTIAVFFLTRPMGAGLLRNLLRVLPGILLVIPAPVPGYDGHLAPAFVVLVFEGLFQREGNPLGALAALATGLAAALLVGWIVTRMSKSSGDPEVSGNQE